MATIEKIEKDILKTKEKIAELQKKVRSLETQKVEAENLQIVQLCLLYTSRKTICMT